MKKVKFLSGIAIMAITLIAVSCQKNSELAVYEENVSIEILDQIGQLGFSTDNVIKTEDGYLVEGDILLTTTRMAELMDDVKLRVGTEEHYRTYNLISDLPRVIKVSVNKKLPSNYGAAVDEAISRYNNENLQISFQRVARRGDIDITSGPKWWNNYGILGEAGFPSANGEPHGTIKMNSTAFKNASLGYLATVIAHEMGHCIGFRHTDYMDRSFSCGGSYSNEGDAGVGAVHIPGTPVNPENRSWMLSCTDGSNRPFTNNDQSALGYLY